MDINKMILNGAYDVGPHAQQRAKECKINLCYVIPALAKTTNAVRSFGPKGEVWIYDKKLKSGKTIRMVVSTNKNKRDRLFVVTIFSEDGEIKSHHSKFADRELVYNFG